MIRYLPDFLPDECLYSLFVRYSNEMGNLSYSGTVKELAGKAYANITPQFVGNLEYFLGQLPDNYGYTSDVLIDSHMILSFYRPFITQNQYCKAKQNILSGKINSVMSCIGMTAGSVAKSNGIKYCPQCVEDDKEQYGKAYLHRIHQLQGVYLCNKHECSLRETARKPSNQLFDIDQYSNVDEDILKDISEEMIKLIEDVEILMKSTDKEDGYEITSKKYISRMSDLGYRTPGGLVTQFEFHEDFLKRYSHEFLQQLDSDIVFEDESNWLRTISRAKQKSVHPIRNLLLINFLFGGYQQFQDYEVVESRPFGTSNYPCLNPGELHYKNLLISSFRINVHPKKGYLYGKFKCPECGFKYTLKCDDYLESGFEKAKNWEKVDMDETQDMDFGSETEIIYADRIKALIRSNPEVTRTDILHQLNTEYRWLYSHNRKLHDSIMPAPKRHKDFYINTRVDWKERDVASVEKVMLAINTIKASPMPIRISRKRIAEICGESSLLRNIEKMPLTEAILREHIEDDRSVHIRRIDFTINEFVKSKKKLVKHMILRQATIPDKYYHDYDEYIEERFNELGYEFL